MLKKKTCNEQNKQFKKKKVFHGKCVTLQNRRKFMNRWVTQEFVTCGKHTLYNIRSRIYVNILTHRKMIYFMLALCTFLTYVRMSVNQVFEWKNHFFEVQKIN